MKPKRQKLSVEARQKQQTPDEIINQIMGYVRSVFYWNHKNDWFKDQHFIKSKIVTWPARWLDDRGVTVKPERYKEILIGIFKTVKNYGQTETVKYWPGYLLHCVHEHFKHHGDEIYEEGKSLRNIMDAILLKCKQSRPPDPVATIAQVNKALATAARKKKPTPAKQQQLSLF